MNRNSTKKSTQDAFLNEISPEDLEHAKKLQIYTKSYQAPKIKEIIFHPKCILRLLQGLLSLFTVICLVLSSFGLRYDSPPKNTLVPGFEFLCLTSVLSMFYSFSFLIVHCFPVWLSLPPYEYMKSGISETLLDIGFVCLWLISTLVAQVYGECVDIRNINCIFWYLCMGFGYFEFILYTFNTYICFKDLRKYKLYCDPESKIYAKGSWNRK